MREYSNGLPLLPGGLVEDENGAIWSEEKNKVGQGGGILEAYLQPGHKGTVEEEEEGGATGGEEGIAPSFYFDKKDDENGGRIGKRAWNSYFTGGFGKRGSDDDTTNKWGKVLPTVFFRPMKSVPGAKMTNMKSVPGAVSLFDTAW